MNIQNMTHLLGELEEMLTSTGYQGLVEQAHASTTQGAEYERFLMLCDLVEARVATLGEGDGSEKRSESIRVILTCLGGLRRAAESASSAAPTQRMDNRSRA
ncbi:hypothetical protein [Corynebacterium occultum]|nr:hypothetical protein [Corynebacterium occultum]